MVLQLGVGLSLLYSTVQYGGATARGGPLSILEYSTERWRYSPGWTLDYFTVQYSTLVLQLGVGLNLLYNTVLYGVATAWGGT
jgi:hypothetical protein